MQSYLEASLKRDIERIRGNVVQMAGYAEEALNHCLKAYMEGNRQLAYTVILRDLYIDEKEEEIDRLCLEFIVRQQPVAFPVRFAYCTIKINLEIERVGDYAERIARNILTMKDKPIEDLNKGIIEIADLSIVMFHDSITSFIEQNPDLAKQTIEIEETVDTLRCKLNKNLIERLMENTISFDMFEPLTGIIRRFERVSDQARNICMEVLYMCTGEQVKHPGVEAFRVIFIDDHNRCRSRMAEAIALSLKNPRFIFTSAGIDPEPIDKATIDFLRAQGIDLPFAASRSIHKIPNLEHYQVIIALSPDARKMFGQCPRKSIFLDWIVDDPSTENDPTAREKAYEETFHFIQSQLTDLVNAIIGNG
jgi:phosphate transport system protein